VKICCKIERSPEALIFFEKLKCRWQLVPHLSTSLTTVIVTAKRRSQMKASTFAEVCSYKNNKMCMCTSKQKNRFSLKKVNYE
jgi:hypothetical protein